MGSILDFDKIWNDLQWRAESVLAKSHILTKYLLLSAIAFFAFALRVVGFLRVRGINEVDDVFNLAMSHKLSSSGLANFFRNQEEGIFFDTSVPFPGLLALVSAAHWVLSFLGVAISAQTLYTLSGPFFGALTAIATYQLGKELKDEATGLVAGATMCLLPGFYALSVDGNSANVVAGSFFMVLSLYFFVKGIKTGVRVYAAYSAFAYFALASLWSGYVFLAIFFAVFVGTTLVLNKASDNVYNTYTIFFGVSTLLTFLLPIGGPLLLLHVEQVPGVAVFVLLQLARHAGIDVGLIKPVAGGVAVLVIGGAILGFLPASKGLAVFWDSLASQPVSWVSFFRDCHLTLFLFPAGVFICLRKRTELNTFFVLYALLSLAFAGTSANFGPVFFPTASIFAAFSLTTTLKAFLKYQETPVVTKKHLGKSISKEINVAVIAGITAIIGFFLVYSFSAATHPSVYRPATLFPAMSHSGQQVVLIDDLREAAAWIRENTRPDARIASWTGLGHRLSLLSRQSVLGSDPHSPQSLDAVAEMLRSDEKAAAALANKLGATHVLVTFGGRTGYTDDDLSHAPEILTGGQGLTEDALLTKLSYRGFADVMTHPQAQPGLDLARGHPVAIRPSLTQFEEVFTSDHSLVRIYKVLSSSTSTLGQD